MTAPAVRHRLAVAADRWRLSQLGILATYVPGEGPTGVVLYDGTDSEVCRQEYEGTWPPDELPHPADHGRQP